MRNADKERLAELRRRSDDAEAIGQAAFECPPDQQAKICRLLLEVLEEQIKRSKSTGAHAAVKQRTFEDLLRVAYQQGIAVGDRWEPLITERVHADAERREKSKKAAEETQRKRSQERAEKADFEAWRAGRANPS